MKLDRLRRLVRATALGIAVALVLAAVGMILLTDVAR